MHRPKEPPQARKCCATVRHSLARAVPLLRPNMLNMLHKSASSIGQGGILYELISRLSHWLL